MLKLSAARTRRGRALLTAAAAGAAVACCAAGASAAPRIAYLTQSEDSEATDLYTIRPDGTGDRQLTHDEFEELDPTWSPNHRYLLFAGDRPHRTGLVVIGSKGKHPHRIRHTGHNDSMPAWSPNGRKIAYIHFRGSNDEIYVINRNGKHRKRLTHTHADETSPDWSPNGRRIVFEVNGGIWVMHRDGSHRVRVTADGHNPNWSRHGNLIVFNRFRADGGSDIWTMRPDGTSQVNVTGADPVLLCTPDSDNTCAREDTSPDWAPGGGRIVFIRDHDGGDSYPAGDTQHGVFTMTRDGSDERKVTTSSSDYHLIDPAW